MRSIRIAFIASVGLLAARSGLAAAQEHGPHTAPAAPRTIEIKLVEQAGPKPYGFDPTAIVAHRGDTLRFVQAASALHDVHFKVQPKGAHLGAAATSQYLTAKGQTYVLVVDSRFADGTYEIVCDPHESIGMHAFLTVTTADGPANP
jgi:plastocyanin